LGIPAEDSWRTCKLRQVACRTTRQKQRGNTRGYLSRLLNGTTRRTGRVRTHIGVLTWVLTLNQEVERTAANIYYDAKKQTDLIDAHDWHFIPAAVTLKKALNIPFIYSVESLEEHRSHGANSPFNMAIKSIEWLGLYEAKKAIVKSEWMRNEIIRIYKVPKEKIKVIPPKSTAWMKTVLETYKSAAGGAIPK